MVPWTAEEEDGRGFGDGERRRAEFWRVWLSVGETCEEGESFSGSFCEPNFGNGFLFLTETLLIRLGSRNDTAR